MAKNILKLLPGSHLLNRAKLTSDHSILLFISQNIIEVNTSHPFIIFMWQCWRTDTLLQCTVVIGCNFKIIQHIAVEVRSLELHPCVKMSKLGRKSQYFVWPPFFSSTIFTRFWMQWTREVAIKTHFHFSMTTSQHWWVLETLCSPPPAFYLRTSYKGSLGFRFGDMVGQAITFTLTFFQEVMVVLEV